MSEQKQQNLSDNYSIQQYFFFTVDDNSKIGLCGTLINTNNQFLFSDLQLMLLNEFISPTLWNKDIETSMTNLIRGLDNSILESNQLSDLYFSDAKSLKLSCVKSNSNSRKNTILSDFQQFVQQLRQKNNKDVNNQQKNLTLQDLIQLALNVYKKIRVGVNPENIIVRNITARYTIDQILMNPLSSAIYNNEVYSYARSKEINEIINSYFDLLKMLLGQKMGTFVKFHIFGKSLNELTNQLSFLRNLQQKSQDDFYQLVLLLINDIDKFKNWSFEWVIKQYTIFELSHKHPIKLKQIMEFLDREKFIDKYSALKDNNLFTFLVQLNQQLTNWSKQLKLELSFSDQEIKNQIKNSLEIIYYEMNIDVNDLSGLNILTITDLIYKEIGQNLIQNGTLIGYLDFSKDIESYLQIRHKFVEIALQHYRNKFVKFFSVPINNDFEEKLNQTVQRLFLEVLQEGLNFTESIFILFNQVKSAIINNIKDDLMTQECLQNFPEVLKNYLVRSFRESKAQNDQFSNFVKENEQLFSVQLNWYIQFLQSQFDKQFTDQPDTSFKTSMVKELKQQFQTSLMEIYVPYINMQQLTTLNIFTQRINREIQRLKGKFQFMTKLFTVYSQFIKASFKQYEPDYEISAEDRNKLTSLEKELLEQSQQLVKNQLFQNNSGLQFIEKSVKQNFREKISNFYIELNQKYINFQIERVNNEKIQLFEEYKQTLETKYFPLNYFLPKIRDIIWYQQENLKDLKILTNFSQTIEIYLDQKLQKFERLNHFGQNNKNRLYLESEIKKLIQNSYQLEFAGEEQLEIIKNELIKKIENYYEVTEDQIVTQIKKEQQIQIDNYLNEIYQLTDQECKIILIPIINLEKVEQIHIQVYENQLSEIVDAAQNQQDLQQKTLQFLKDEILNFVLNQYEQQIEKELERIIQEC